LVVDGAVFADYVFHFYVVYYEGIGEEVSVASPGQRFRTHQRQTVLSCEGNDF
jgi:hypothetical protein